MIDLVHLRSRVKVGVVIKVVILFDLLVGRRSLGNVQLVSDVSLVVVRMVIR